MLELHDDWFSVTLFKEQESPVKGHNCGFLPLVFLENKALEFSKWALRAGTVRNEWLK